jgi:hypothetical protein
VLTLADVKLSASVKSKQPFAWRLRDRGAPMQKKANGFPFAFVVKRLRRSAETPL